MNEPNVDIGRQLSELSNQVAALSEQVRELGERTTYLADEAGRNQRRQQEWDELKADATPVVNDLYLATVEQLGALEPHVQLDDLVRLLTRVARNTRNIEAGLDQLESLRDFVDDVGPLTHDIFEQTVLTLEDMERRGYFGFVRASSGIADNIVDSFTEDDVTQLGDNIVLILNTVKAMTQPEIMNLVNNITVTYQEVDQQPDELPTSALGLLRQMRDPEVRRGMALTMRMLKAVAHQDEVGSNGDGAMAAGTTASG